MTMQAALKRALDLQCFARPIGAKGYAYRYRPNGKRMLLSVRALGSRYRVGRPLREDEAFGPNLSSREIEDEWVLCHEDGSDYREPMVCLSDFV